MPKDRKKTYSDHQSQAARLKKEQSKKQAVRQDFSQSAKRTVPEATKN